MSAVWIVLSGLAIDVVAAFIARRDSGRRSWAALDGPAWLYAAALAATGWVVLAVGWQTVWPLWVALGHGVVALELLVGAIAGHGDRSPR